MHRAGNAAGKLGSVPLPIVKRNRKVDAALIDSALNISAITARPRRGKATVQGAGEFVAPSRADQVLRVANRLGHGENRLLPSTELATLRQLLFSQGEVDVGALHSPHSVEIVTALTTLGVLEIADG
eukprot:SAG11_NODE_21903_length_416_cov_0.977918_1_plen_126_part_10